MGNVFMVFWVNLHTGTESSKFDKLGQSLTFMQKLRADPANKFITMASEIADNVGLIGVDEVLDGKCPDGGDFLGRLSRYGITLRREKG